MTRPLYTFILTLLALTFITSSASAQYNRAAGQSAPKVAKEVRVFDEKSKSYVKKKVKVAPTKDSYGNAAGTNFDLAVDGAFEGQTVVVAQFYSFGFEKARAALKQKGFGVYRWNNTLPPVKEFETALNKASQFWLISGSAQHLTPGHIKVIQKFFNSGKGVYIWGDNTPFHTDANVLASALFDSSMKGNYMGNKVVQAKKKGVEGGPQGGLVPDHLLTTGLEHIFEGITIAAIKIVGGLKPLIWSSDGNVVTAIYEDQGRRAILDGGFTRLYNNWDSAGTGRYVKNAAAWLANAERFGTDVVAKKGDVQATKGKK